jgi:hypothetical protein
MEAGRPSRSIWWGLIASVLFHTLGAGVLVTRGVGVMMPARTPPREPEAPVPPRPEDPSTPEPLHLGIDRPDPVATLTWIGYEDYREHLAPKSEVEQAAMVMHEAGEAQMTEPAEDAPAAPAPPRPDLSAEATEHDASKDAAVAPPARPSPPPTPSPQVQIAEQPTPAQSPPDAAAPEIKPSAATEEAKPEPRSQPEAPAAQPEPAPTSPPVAASPLTPEPNPPAPPAQTKDAAAKAPSPAGKRGAPGDLSDRESVATALKEAVNVTPGRPLAAQGLKIKTVQPEFELMTRLTARPHNPVLRISFDRTGKVKKAQFLRGHTTGYLAVDEPLQNAIYRWTAEGKALQDLSETDPEAAINITVHVLLGSE